MKTPNQLFRDNNAKALKEIHGAILRGNDPILDDSAKLAWMNDQEKGVWDSLPSMLVLLALVAAFCFIGSCQTAHAEVTESQAVKIIVGEASNQGFKGMVCVAEVLRHRNSVKGFYGLNAKHSSKEPKWVWLQAKKAWLASESTNYTRHADHMENINAFGKPYWVKNCIETFRYLDHIFYKEIV